MRTISVLLGLLLLLPAPAGARPEERFLLVGHVVERRAESLLVYGCVRSWRSLELSGGVSGGAVVDPLAERCVPRAELYYIAPPSYEPGSSDLCVSANAPPPWVTLADGTRTRAYPMESCRPRG